MSTVVQTKPPIEPHAEDRPLPLVSVVIPCLNEAENIEPCVTAALQALEHMGVEGEVVVADNNSEDNSAQLAARAGARIVHCCGFDSVPSDLGVLLLHHAARADDAGDLQDTTLVVAALRGGISGGTLASLTGQQDEVRAGAERCRVVRDPYALSPDRGAEPGLGDERGLGPV